MSDHSAAAARSHSDHDESGPGLQPANTDRQAASAARPEQPDRPGGNRDPGAGRYSGASGQRDAAGSVRSRPRGAGGGDGADPLAGRRAVVTGAASGIGAAVAHKLAEEGADVRLVDQSPDVAEVAARVGGEARVVDLSDPDAAAEVGVGADIVINNAGVQHVAPVHRFPPDAFATLLRLMLESPFRIVRAALPGMYERHWGRIVNISSVHGLRASPYKSAYVAAKHGLEGLSKTIALETAGYGITSNCVCPGYVRTPLVERQVSEQALLHRVPEQQVIEDVLLARMPVKRLVEADEVADLVAWLCDAAATSVTGTSLPMDGGWSAQ